MAAALATPDNGSSTSAPPQQAQQQQAPAQQHDEERSQQAAESPAPLPVPATVLHVVTAPAPGRQLGRVALLKKEFGFIRQMERPGDLFFHFSQLDGIPPAELKVLPLKDSQSPCVLFVVCGASAAKSRPEVH